MTKNIRYKRTLIPNLMTACIASERRDEKMLIKPRIMARENLDLEPATDKRTFVMRWNPEISSYKVVDFERAMENFHDGIYFDWSIWEHEKVRIGDRFYMLKVGNGTTGIVMSGTIVGLPYKDEDWSGQGRDVRYVRMIPDFMVHPEKSHIVTIDELDTSLPGTTWNEGHSGVMLNSQQKLRFDEIWMKYLQNIAKKQRKS